MNGSRLSASALMCFVALLVTALAGLAPPVAGAETAAPVVVPAPDSDGIPSPLDRPTCAPRAGYTQANGGNPWRTCLLPDSDPWVDWPDSVTGLDPYFWPGPRSFILTRPGLSAQWWSTGLSTIWYDVGSGFPATVNDRGLYGFPAAGKYSWECSTCIGPVRAKLQGTMYVIGPRATASGLPISNSTGGTVAYGFDASSSFVTDYTSHSIVEYAFDFQDDGTYDQVSPEPTAQTQLTPGAHIVRVRVRDDIGRTAEYPLPLDVTALPATGTGGGTQPSGTPPPPPTPLQFGGREGVSINAAADYTNDSAVTLRVVAPLGATTLLVSNDGGFADATTLPVNLIGEHPWRLRSTGSERLPKVVYVRFVGGLGIDAKTFTDDIILDQTRPRITEASTGPPRGRATAATRAKVLVKATDNLSGIGGVQITASRAKPGRILRPAKKFAKSRALSQAFPAPPTTKRLWARVVDRAGNASAWRSVTG